MKRRPYFNIDYEGISGHYLIPFRSREGILRGMMKYFLVQFVIVSFLLIAPSSGAAQMHAVSSLVPIQKELETCNEDTLVLLDVGGTLLAHKDPVLHKDHEHWKRKWFEQHYPQLTREEKISLVRVVEENIDDWRLLDTWPELIEELQHRNIKVVAFTKVLMDPSLEQVHVARLAKFNLSIQDNLPELAGIGDQYVYVHGVIQTGELLKGPALKEVLNNLKKAPGKIVFVDDRKEQLESVQQACDELGIPIICFHYAARDDSPILDEVIANYQLHILVNEHRWITSEKIKDLKIED